MHGQPTSSSGATAKIILQLVDETSGLYRAKKRALKPGERPDVQKCIDEILRRHGIRIDDSAGKDTARQIKSELGRRGGYKTARLRRSGLFSKNETKRTGDRPKRLLFKQFLFRMH